jgi:ankyrin repeat protein
MPRARNKLKTLALLLSCLIPSSVTCNYGPMAPALTDAAQRGEIETLESLLECSTNPFKQNIDGILALEHAAFSKDLEMFILLLEYNTPIQTDI